MINLIEQRQHLLGSGLLGLLLIAEGGFFEREFSVVCTAVRSGKLSDRAVNENAERMSAAARSTALRKDL